MLTLNRRLDRTPATLPLQHLPLPLALPRHWLLQTPKVALLLALALVHLARVRVLRARIPLAMQV